MNWKKLVLEQAALIEQLRARIVELEAEVAALKTINAALKSELAAARKNSSNSSKPPSSDIVKPPKGSNNGKDANNKDKNKVKRKRGAQKGHKQNLRKPLAPELIDETSFKKNGKLQWAWCFVAEFFTFFKIDASRGSKVLHETLGADFLGSISSDFFSAYLKYRRETETLFQFCWAHLIREIKFLATLSDTKAYGKRLLKYVKYAETGEKYLTMGHGSPFSQRVNGRAHQKN